MTATSTERSHSYRPDFSDVRVLLALGLPVGGTVTGHRTSAVLPATLDPETYARVAPSFHRWHADPNCSVWPQFYDLATGVVIGSPETAPAITRTFELAEVARANGSGPVPDDEATWEWCVLCRPALDLSEFGDFATSYGSVLRTIGDALATPLCGGHPVRTSGRAQDVSNMFTDKVPGCLEQPVTFADVLAVRNLLTVYDLFEHTYPRLHTAVARQAPGWAAGVEAFMETDAWPRMQAALLSDLIAETNSWRRQLRLPETRWRSKVEKLVRRWYDAPEDGWADLVRADLSALAAGPQRWVGAYPTELGPAPAWKNPIDGRHAYSRVSGHDQASQLVQAFHTGSLVARFPGLRARTAWALGKAHADKAGTTILFRVPVKLADTLGFTIAVGSYADETLLDRGYGTEVIRTAALLHDGGSLFEPVVVATAAALTPVP